MNVYLKNTLKFGSLLIVLFLIIAILITLLVDINQYKDEIAQLVEEETGLKLEIKSDMTLSLISGGKFNVNKIKLSNDKSLIADIDSLSLGLDLYSLYSGKPKITSVNLNINALHISRDKKGTYNFLPSQNNNSDANNYILETENLPFNHLSIKNIKLSIKKLVYKDDIKSLSMNFKALNASLSLLPMIDHQELIIDDPRILVNYSYSGVLSFKQAMINQYKTSDFMLNFEDRMGHFTADKLAFKLTHKGVEKVFPSFLVEAIGKLSIKLVYNTPKGEIEPLWAKPDIIRVGSFDFKLPKIELKDKQYKLNTKQAHLTFKEVAVFEEKQFALDNLQIKSLTFDSHLIDLNWENKDEYHFKKAVLQLSNLPVISNGKPLGVTSDIFLKKFAQKGNIKLSIDSISN